MIVLDTNVISALMRKEPEKPVVKWLDAQPAASVWITAITVMEIRFGLQTMPKGRRQDALLGSFELMLKTMIEGRIASFDAEAGIHVAQHPGMEHGKLQSTFPVSWPAMAVGHGQDQDRSFRFSINHQVRKTRELEFAGAPR